MSTTDNLERTPDASTKTVANPSMPAASTPPALKDTAHVSEAPELDGLGDNAARHGEYYLQLAVFTAFVLLGIVMSTLPYGLDHINNTFAALAKVVLMAVVAYLPGHGPTKLGRELSDICQWVLLIAAMAITIFIGDTSMLGSHLGLFGIAYGLFSDCAVCWFAMAWKSYSRARQIVYFPHRLIAVLLQRPLTVASQGEDYA
ncbi:hypothetical protein C8F01DRAFT_1256406 [Mycena amicta]|nr:hypothetical protein C8F01DRAFT_1256406 [Mycena amicta]